MFQRPKPFISVRELSISLDEILITALEKKYPNDTFAPEYIRKIREIAAKSNRCNPFNTNHLIANLILTIPPSVPDDITITLHVELAYALGMDLKTLQQKVSELADVDFILYIRHQIYNHGHDNSTVIELKNLTSDNTESVRLSR